MPKKPIDYTKSCVYRLIHNHITYYVGSTTNMRQRKGKHKNNTNSKKSDKYDMELYKFIRENGGFDDWTMVMIQAYPDCKNSDELRKHERDHYDIFRPPLNSQRPYITEEERVETQRVSAGRWREDNKEQIVVNKAEYYQENKERILEKCRLDYAENNEKQLQYYQDNKEIINEKKKERCMCECGVTYASRHRIVHQKTQKHINLMLQKKK